MAKAFQRDVCLDYYIKAIFCAICGKWNGDEDKMRHY